MPFKKKSSWVAGADACKAGWVIVLRHVHTGATRLRIVPDVEALMQMSESPALCGIDMVIGLPKAARSGGRACDRAARALLGWPRSSSVFSPPCRAALQADTYAAAQRRNRASHSDQVGLTKQAFHLFPKIKALDRAMSPQLQQYIREVHPECSFYALNGGAALADSKHTDVGKQHRIQLLQDAGFHDLDAALHAHPRGDASVDDILDAHAVCWTAQRIHDGTAQQLPNTDAVPTDERGLRMEIWR